jgi:hypothetical protein
LRFLVDRQHQGVLRGIDIKADDILHLRRELRIVRQLEGPHPVRFEAMRCPDALHTAVAHPDRLGHRPAGPVRRLAQRFGQRHLDYPLDSRRRQRRHARGPRCLMQQAINSLRHEARLPAPNRRFAFAGLPLDRHRADPSGAQQHNPRPPHMLLRAVPDPITASSRSRSPGPSRTSTPLRIPIDSHIRAPHWNHSSASIH